MGSRPPGGDAAGLNRGDRAGDSFEGHLPEEPGPIEVVLDDPAWRAAVPRAEAAARRAALAALEETGADGAVTLLLTGDRAVMRLNTDHRGKAKATNVLSFPAGHPGMLGDVALALGTVRREARAAGRTVLAHLSHLVAHGVLHLAGHDHLRAGEARRMERAEARIMRRLALPNPWRGAT